MDGHHGLGVLTAVERGEAQDVAGAVEVGDTVTARLVGTTALSTPWLTM